MQKKEYSKVRKIAGGVSKIKTHPKRKEIVSDITHGVPIDTIAKTYNLSASTITRYRDELLSKVEYDDVQHMQRMDAASLYNVITKAVLRMEMLSDSCDIYLRDPEDSNRYYMGPRAAELDVVWYELDYDDEGKTHRIRHKDTLQDLLDRMTQDNPDMRVKAITAHPVDPRILLVKASETLAKQMDTMINAWRSVDEGRSSFIGTPAWDKVVQAILVSTEGTPEVRRKIAKALEALN